MIRLLTLFSLFMVAAPPLFAAAPVQEVMPGLWLIEDHTLPIVTVKMSFEQSGSAYDPGTGEGLASFMSQLLDEGAGDMNSLAFNRALDDKAIRMNFDASEDRVTANLQTLSEFKGEALRLFTLALTSPRFDADAIERIRASILSDLKQLEQDPGYLAALTWKKLVYAGHPYEHPGRGNAASVAAITRQDIKAYADKQFFCRRKTVAVVGDITVEEVKKWASQFSLADTCPAPAPAVADITPPAGTTPVLVERPFSQTVVRASLPSFARNDPRYYAEVVLNHILGGNPLTARLGKEIRDKRGLAYYAGTDIEILEHAHFITASFATRGPQAGAAVKVFLNELTKISTGGVSGQELTDAKSYLTGSFPLQIDNQGALADYLLSMQHFDLGSHYLEQRNVLINAVTLAQVNEAARTLFAQMPFIVMVGEAEGKKP